MSGMGFEDIMKMVMMQGRGSRFGPLVSQDALAGYLMPPVPLSAQTKREVKKVVKDAVDAMKPTVRKVYENMAQPKPKRKATQCPSLPLRHL